MTAPPARTDLRSVPRPPGEFASFPASGRDGPLGPWLDATVIEPVSAVQYHCSADYQVGPRTCSDSMWLCLLSGRARGWVGPAREAVSLGPGDLFLVPSQTAHMLANTCCSSLDLVSAHFHACLYGIVDLLAWAGFPPVSRTSRDAPFERISSRLAREYAIRPPGWRRALEVGILEGLFYVARFRGCAPRYAWPVAAQRELRRLLPALEYLERNLGSPDLTVGDIARCVHLSEVQFRKLFRRLTRTSPVRFVRRRRVQLACLLLRQTDEDIKRVAEDCGFSDVLYFHKVFRAATGTTPGLYREARET